MCDYSVAAAKAGSPSLTNRAMAGEEVVITRHGKPVVRLHPATDYDPAAAKKALERLIAGRITPSVGTPISVELINMIYDDPEP